ncbi:MAG TPA: hypothetical protein VMT43_08650, partial [Acidimicrobiales bacterium]|nr:hypothetical protein [Acidimicrobiales bacterium]
MGIVAPPAGEAGADRARVDELPRVAWPMVIVLAVAKVAFQLATSALYGPHRDEFYYLESGYHLAWGYVDNPPMIPGLDRLGVAIFGHSVTGLHVMPA